MDAIALIIVLFLNFSPACSALPADLTMLSHRNYRILRWDCGKQQFHAWQQQCQDGSYSVPFYLEEMISQRGFYVNRFGEIIAAGTNIEQVEAHAYGCPA